ncbi:MAG: methionine--tRNA ligase [Candidatus Aenigmarchaeota archaeon ex4484_56]|nr:MAG: methionine--tRNA ligase [Candidatus Aenigmarchaeota archaeon ex4484_56]
MQKLITSALPYIHGIPHLGNIIGSVLPADVYSKFCRLKGEKTLFICGSDSHGTMFEIAAKKEGITPEELVYRNHEKVKAIFSKFEIEFDYYGITHSETNRKFTYHIFKKLDENRYIKEKYIESAYCENCNLYLADRWIEGNCPYCNGLARGDQCDDCGKLLDIKEIIKPYCVLCKNKIIFKKTKHLFFDLPKLEPKIKKFVKNSTGWSNLAKKETIGFLKQKLKERSITRDSNWGFKVPKKGYENKVFYVWFDAPIGYISFTEEWCEKNNENLEDWWKNENVRLVQFMGKDNTIFHTIIFPAMLIGCDEKWKLADRIISCGWLKTKDIKFSKSRGKGMTTEEALKKYPPDCWRYILTSLYPEQDDTLFSNSILKEKINNEFANIVGNFVHRVLSFCYSNFGEIPKISKYNKNIEVGEIFKEITKNFENCRFRSALNSIIHYAKISNAYFNNSEPWNKDDEKKKEICFYSGNLVKNIAIMLYPIVPNFSKQVFEFLNLNINKLRWEDANKFNYSSKIKKPKPLINKI